MLHGRVCISAYVSVFLYMCVCVCMCAHMYACVNCMHVCVHVSNMKAKGELYGGKGKLIKKRTGDKGRFYGHEYKKKKNSKMRHLYTNDRINSYFLSVIQSSTNLKRKLCCFLTHVVHEHTHI